MSSTDAALDWLLSLSATFTSSPVPNSDAPDLFDWLHVSPTSSLTSEAPFSTSPLQDVTCSSQINIRQQDQAQDIELACLWDDTYFNSDLGDTSASQGGRNAQDLNFRNGQFANSAQFAMFNDHHRTISMDSTTGTLVNTPSPRPRISSSGPADLIPTEPDTRSPFSSSLLCSPGTKLLQELQTTAFGSYFSDIAAPSLSDKVTADDSPIVRAADLQDRHFFDDKSPMVKPKSKAKPKKTKKGRRAKPGKQFPSFVDKLRATEKHASQSMQSGMTPQQTLGSSNELRPPLLAMPTPAMPDNPLMSPCRIKFKQSTPPRSDNTVQLSNSPAMKLTSLVIAHKIKESPPATPSNAFMVVDALSPLTPLSSLPSSPDSVPRLKTVLNLKRESPSEDSEPFLRRSKRPRKVMTIIESPLSTTKSSPMQTPAPSQEAPTEEGATVFTNRTLPSNVEVSDNFPLFYRRYPVSSYYQHGEANSPCTLFKVDHPGGVYNPPRSALDLYTPRFVKGRGVEKVGLCPICIEPPARGGAGKKLWFAMKFSAFNYHMQYAHGISASMGRPFSPPTVFRVVPRPEAGKKEKLQIQQGKCHKCRKWVPVEGIKDMESKVKELHWWKHAAACHQESTLDGENHYYEDDHMLSVICSLCADLDASSVV